MEVLDADLMCNQDDDTSTWCAIRMMTHPFNHRPHHLILISLSLYIVFYYLTDCLCRKSPQSNFLYILQTDQNPFSVIKMFLLWTVLLSQYLRHHPHTPHLMHFLLQSLLTLILQCLSEPQLHENWDSFCMIGTHRRKNIVVILALWFFKLTFHRQ